MRSRSRSPRRGERRGPVSGRLLTRERRNLKRSRSRSTGKGRDFKARSVTRSVSPKRRRSSPVDERRGAKRMEGPCKREADSTDMPHKLLGRKSPPPRNRPFVGTKGDASRLSHKDDSTNRSRPGQRVEQSKLHGRRSPGTEASLVDKADRKRGSSKGRGEKVSKEPAASKKHSSKPNEQTAKEDSSKFRAFDQTSVTMNDRFSTLGGVEKPFVPEENVSIEIERAVEGRAVPFEMPLFWSDAVVIVRRPDEGKKPLTDRDEFRHRPEETEEERRTVKVKKNLEVDKADGRQNASDSRKKSDNHGRVESRRTWHRRSPATRPHKFEDDRNILRNARDLLISMKTRNDAESQQRPPKRSVVSASNVGRNYLLPAAAVLTGELPLHAGSSLNHRERESGRSMTMYNSAAAGRPSVPGSQPQQLPDFAHRPDKYQYEEWKNRPELIPKGRSYFEHDDRDAADESWNGRGRRGGRGGGRGRGRGVFNRLGGGPRMASSNSDVWRHDKFDELVDNQQPSSSS